MKGWKYALLLILFALLNYLFVQWNKAESIKRKGINIQDLQIKKDSLFKAADRVVDSIDKNNQVKENQIKDLENKLHQKPTTLTKTVVVEKYIKDTTQNKLMASGYNFSEMEKEINKKQRQIGILLEINTRLNKENDSLRQVIDNK